MHTAPSSIWILALALSLSSISTRADSFSVNGTAVSSSIEQAIEFSGALSGVAITAEGPSIVGLFNPGSVVQLSLPIGIIFEPDAGFVSLTFGGKTTDIALGGLVFSGTFVVPTASPGDMVNITLPVSMIGNVIAFEDLTLGQGFQTQGPQIFDLRLRGSGTMMIAGEVLENGPFVKLDSASISFGGSATTVPEPSSMVLLGSGIMGIIGARRQRIKAHLSR